MAPTTKFLPLGIVEASCGVSLRQGNSVRSARRKTCRLEVLPDNSQVWYWNKPGLGWTKNLLGRSWTWRSVWGTGDNPRRDWLSRDTMNGEARAEWWPGMCCRTASPSVTPPEGWETEGRGTEREEGPSPCSGHWCWTPAGPGKGWRKWAAACSVWWWMLSFYRIVQEIQRRGDYGWKIYSLDNTCIHYNVSLTTDSKLKTKGGANS